MVVDVQGKSDLTPLFSRDAATVRDLERAVVSLRQQVAQVQAPRGAIAPPALAGVGRAQDQLAAAQRQAVQVAARAALPPGLPRAGPGASLVPRPEMGAGVFGAGDGGPAAAALARQQASNLARQNEWTRGQDRLAALAGAGRGPTSQGPQAAREMADAAERLNRTLRDSAGLTRQATDAEQARGRAVGSSAAAVAGAAALGAGVAAAAGGGGGRAAGGGGRAVRVAGEGSVGGISRGQSFLDRVLGDGGDGSIRAQSKAAGLAFGELAKKAGKVAASADTALGAPDVLASTSAAAAPTRREAIATARVQSARDLSAALLDKTRAAFLQTEGATPASLAGQFQKEFDRSQRAAVVARGEAAGFNAEAQRRRAGVIEGEDFRHATGQGLVSENLNASNAARAARIAAEDRRGLLDHPEFVTRRQQEAAAGLAERGTAAAERVRAAAVLAQLQGGGAYRGAAALEARAGIAEGTAAARGGRVDAQELARASGSKEGQAELKTTAALRRQEATAMRSVRWNEAVAAQGKLGASLTWASGAAKTLGDSARNAFLFRVAEAGLLVGAASPSTMATLTGSVEMLAAAMGKSLIPAVDSVSLKLQQFSRGYGQLSPGAQQGISTTFLATTGIVGGLWGLARVIQGAKWLWVGASGLGGIRGAALWTKDALGFGAARGGVFPANMGPGVAAAGGGNGTLFGMPLGGAVGGFLGGLTAATAGLMLFKYALEEGTQKNRAAVDRAVTADERLRRQELDRSETFRKIAGAASGDREGVANEELEAARVRFEQASRQNQAVGMGAGTLNNNYSPLGSLFQAAGLVGPSRADRARDELNDAAKQYAIARAARRELVEGKKFEQAPLTGAEAQAEQQQKLLRSLRGLPQSFMTETGVEYANRITLAAQRPEGELDKQNWANQLKLLTKTGDLLEKIERNTSPTVPRAANVNDRP